MHGTLRPITQTPTQRMNARVDDWFATPRGKEAIRRDREIETKADKRQRERSRRMMNGARHLLWLGTMMVEGGDDD